MFGIDGLILLCGILFLLGIVSSKFSARLGLPVLVLFLGIGMLAGSEGIGGVHFENYTVAHGLGTLALAVILFDGGLRTPFSAVRAVLGPALALSTGGVLLTALLTGLVAAHLLGLPPLVGLLLGSIVSSTDAAAVFSVLRSRGLNVPQRIESTLEVESGANDPMAVFLTIALLELLIGTTSPGADVLWLFFRQMALGGIFGLLVGWGAVRLINRLNLEAAGLYPVLAGVAALLAYGLAASLGGSGFLAVYLAGMVVGNSRIIFKRGIFLFLDGGAWIAQIAMFVLLGLLSFPSRLADVAGEGLLVAGVLILVARPAAVFACLLPFRFSWREIVFVSWAGLKGAVPIILATYPLLYGYPDAVLIFNVVFFAVFVSAILQGGTLPQAARALGLQRPPPDRPPVSLEITSLRHLNGDIVDYTLPPDSRAAGRRIRDLALPDETVIALISRDAEVIPPRGSTILRPGDHVFVVLRPSLRPVVDAVFSRSPQIGAERPPMPLEFPLRGSASVRDLREFYGLRIEGPPSMTLEELFRERAGPKPVIGSRLTFDGHTLIVREIVDGRIERVGIVLVTEPSSERRPPPE